LAARKCPSSWIRVRKPITNMKRIMLTTVDSMF
jgi:hypothetical protein